MTREPAVCEKCGKPLTHGSRGPRRRFCSDKCRLSRSRVVAMPAAWGDGVMQRAASRLAEALGRQTNAITDARVVSLVQLAIGLDAAPGSGALWSQWLGLLRDLQRDQDGDEAAQTELASVLATVRPQVRR